MSQLYPPLIEGTLPPFKANSADTSKDMYIDIPFTMSRLVGISEISGFSLKIKTISTGQLLGTLSTLDYFPKNAPNTARFRLSGNPDKDSNEYEQRKYEWDLRKKMAVGQYYKVQLAYKDKEGNVGIYSSAGVIKKTGLITIEVQNLDSSSLVSEQISYVGKIETEDPSEKLQSYRFKVLDSKGDIFEDSGEKIYYAGENDTKNTFYTTFTPTQELLPGEVYNIEYSITTIGGISASKNYRVQKGNDYLVPPTLEATLLIFPNVEEGYIELKLDSLSNDNIVGKFTIKRRKEQEPGRWEKILNFYIVEEPFSSFSYKDFTVEQGVKYVYALQECGGENVYSKHVNGRVYSHELNQWIEQSVSVDFEHCFLYDGERQLKIKYNPEISSFKTNILETKTETIGSKYPFIFKNGIVSYKEFPISGLISHNSDEERLFIKDENFFVEGQENFSVGYSEENVYRERLFKLEVLNWLNNGKPKLFRSPHEGNYIVYLTGNSLSPKQEVGRMLHTFSSTAFEIAPCTYENLLTYNIVNVNDLDIIRPARKMWKTVNVYRETFDYNINGWGALKVGSDEIYEVHVENMTPGDRFKIKYLDEDNLERYEEIVIGATGKYHILENLRIQQIYVHKDNTKVEGTIHLGYISKNWKSDFERLYYSTEIDNTYVQCFKTCADLQKINDVKRKVQKIHWIKFELNDDAETESAVTLKNGNNLTIVDLQNIKSITYENLDLERIVSMGKNVVAYVCYEGYIITYNYEMDEQYNSYNKRIEYNKAVNDFNKSFGNGGDITECANKVKKAYSELLKAVEVDIEQEGKKYGK